MVEKIAFTKEEIESRVKVPAIVEVELKHLIEERLKQSGLYYRIDTMIWEDLNENLIVPDLEAKSSDEVFEKLGGLFIVEGYCKDTYIDALKDREKDFPTGVNMGSIGIAIPHTDKQHVIKGGVAIGVLKEPVHFFQMGTTDEPVEVKLVFMLAVEDPKEHLVFLQRILAVLQDQDVLAKIMKTGDKKKIVEIIKEKESNL